MTKTYRQAGFLLLLFLGTKIAVGQTAGSDTTLKAKNLSEIVVTATRSDRKVADVPIPVTIIGQDQIQSSGASRLDEILSEQTGLAIIQDHGLGLQVQGLDPEYTLIMMNGEPIIGRTSGTLDLDRITVSNVERIEIIKGPSSSLYGSDALGGVVNIITKDFKHKGLSLKTQYGSHQTSDNTLNASSNWGKKGNVFFSLNQFHTDGYNLRPESTSGKTVDPYTNYTFRGKIRYRFTPKLELELGGQYYTEKQKNDYLSVPDKDTIHIKGDGKEKDGQIDPVLTYRFSRKWNIKLRNYWSQYKSITDRKDVDADTVFENDFYREGMWKEELQSENILSNNQILTLGTGFTDQSVKASYYDDIEHLYNYYIYAQHEWHPTARWNILSGLRYDMPSAYRSQLSPKIAVQYKLNRHWSFQASAGVGYKAPDLRQLYVSWSNPTVGYSAFGTKVIQQGLEEMERQGLIDHLYVNPADAAKDLKPESSMAYNFGGTYQSTQGWSLEINFFRNDIKDMIDTYVAATKTNGQSFFGYHNIHKVFTEGAEVNGSLPLLNHHLILRAGYQFLIAKDKEVVEDIRNGQRFSKDPKTGTVKKLTSSDYGGLFNRSRHSFNIKLYYTLKTWSFNTRLIYRGRYGYADMNGDNILDAENEYAPAHTMVHLNIQKTFLNQKITAQFGIKDLFNYTDAQHLSYVPGRIWSVRAAFNLFKN